MAEPWAMRLYKSAEWKRIRDAYAESQHWRCERCGSVRNLQVHHKEPLTPETVCDPRMAYDPRNLELLCGHCHNEEHGRGFHPGRHEGHARPLARKGCWFDSDGRLHHEDR